MPRNFRIRSLETKFCSVGEIGGGVSFIRKWCYRYLCAWRAQRRHLFARTAESMMSGLICSGKGEIFWRKTQQCLQVYPFCFDMSMNSKEWLKTFYASKFFHSIFFKFICIHGHRASSELYKETLIEHIWWFRPKFLFFFLLWVF